MFNVFLKLSSIFIVTLVFTLTNSFAGDNGYKDYTDLGKLAKSDLTIGKIVSEPNKFDRDIITIDGVISKVQYRKLPNGKEFTLFKLEDSNDNNVKVYARGHIKEINEGSLIRIHGRYSKEKRFFLKKHKHVMKARKIQIMDSELVDAY